MATNDVRFHVGVRDNASRPIKDIHDAWVRLQKRGAEGFIAGTTAAATYAAFGLMQAGVRELTQFFGDSIRAAAEEEKSIRRLDAALRANVPAWSGNTKAIEVQIKARQALAFSDDALRDSLSLLVAATNDVTAAQNIQRTAMDLARLKGIDLVSATEALIRVEGGQYRILKSLGIEIAANATRQEALAAVQRAAAGQAEAFAQTTAGAMEAAGVAVQDLQEEIGQRLAPAVRDAANWIRTDLVPALSTLAEHAGNAVEGVGNLVDGLLELHGLKPSDDEAAYLKLQEEATRAAAIANSVLIEATNELNAAQGALQVAFASGTITEEEYRAQSEALIEAYQRKVSMTERHIATTNADWQETERAAQAFVNAKVALDALTDSTPSATDAMYDYGAALGTATAQAWALAEGLSAVRQAEASVDIAPPIGGGVGAGRGPRRDGETMGGRTSRVPSPPGNTFIPRPTRRGGGGGASSAEKAARERREALVREERAALDEMNEAGRAYIDAVHDRNMRVIDEAHRVAQERIKASHEATRKQIDNDHKAAQKAIEEAHRAANAEIAAERKAVDARLREQRRMNASAVTAAEQAQSQIEAMRAERDLRERLAEATASGDARAIRDAQEALQSFGAQRGIEALRAQQEAADEAADREAGRAQAELDARQQAEDAAYEQRKSEEQATYEARVAEEDARYDARVAAEDARYRQKKKDEDARWQLQKAVFEDQVTALEESAEMNTRLAQIERLRYLQEQRKIAVSEGASRFEIAQIDREIAAAQKALPGRASGGPVWSGASYLVGERGPEVLTMGRSGGYVTPNNALGGVSIAPGAIVINGAGRNAREIAREVMGEMQREMTRNRYSTLRPR